MKRLKIATFFDEGEVNELLSTIEPGNVKEIRTTLNSEDFDAYPLIYTIIYLA